MDSFDLVTGGAGFIGSHLVDALVAAGRSVRVVDNFASGSPANLTQYRGAAHVEVVEGDVANRALMREVMAGAERVFHLAALADIVPSIQASERYFDTNVNGTYSVCEAARLAGVKRFVYAASSSCYGIPDVYPTPEDTPTAPQYPYALTKYLGEQIVIHWAQLYGLPALSLRLFNVFGPRARTNGTYGAVFGVFLAQMLAGKPLTIVGDGTQTRDFTFVSDVVNAFVTAAASDKTQRIYNVGTANPQSVNHLVELLGAREVVNIPKRPGEPDCTMADVTRITDEIGWRATTSFEEGVKVMVGNIEHWREAPVWTTDKIAEATAEWFRYLGK